VQSQFYLGDKFIAWTLQRKSAIKYVILDEDGKIKGSVKQIGLKIDNIDENEFDILVPNFPTHLILCIPMQLEKSNIRRLISWDLLTNKEKSSYQLIGKKQDYFTSQNQNLGFIVNGDEVISITYGIILYSFN
jgi:hypothetical protein